MNISTFSPLDCAVGTTITGKNSNFNLDVMRELTACMKKLSQFDCRRFNSDYYWILVKDERTGTEGFTKIMKVKYRSEMGERYTIGYTEQLIQLIHEHESMIQQ